jgi:hypothetical protein
MRVAEDDTRAHRHQLVGEEQAALEHLLEDEQRAERLRRDRDCDRRQVGWERGPRAVLDLRDVATEIVLHDELLPRRHVDARVTQLEPDAEPRERRQDRGQVSDLDFLDRHPAAGDRREPDERGDLDVVGADAPLASAQRVDAVDAKDVRLDPFDVRAERDEEAAQVLHVRLAGRVADHGLARCEHGGHDGVLRRHDARLVEEDVVAAQPVGRAHLEAAAELDFRAELSERVDVRIEAAAADDVAARRRNRDRAEP